MTGTRLSPGWFQVHMVKTKNSTPTTPPTTSTLKTANKLDAYTALGEASDTLNLPGYLGMHLFLYFR